MAFNCAGCNVCEEIVGKQENERVHFFGSADAKVLVLDDTNKLEWCSVGMDMAQTLLGMTTNFTYTTTVRCESNGLSDESREKVLSSCAVWTNSLLENRSVVLATRHGLRQMRVGLDKAEGEMFKNLQYGLVLVIPPLMFLPWAEIAAYTTKAKRLLREAGIT